MREERLKWIKERIEGHDAGKYHDASDMAVGFRETVNDALDLVEEVERLGAFEERVKSVLAEHLEKRRVVLAEQDAPQSVDRMDKGTLADYLLFLDVEIAMMRKLLEEDK